MPSHVLRKHFRVKFNDVDLTGARFRLVDLTGVTIRGALMANMDISGELENVLRRDEPRPSWPRERVLQGAPDVAEGGFRVPSPGQ